MHKPAQTAPHDSLAWPKCEPHGNPQWHCAACEADLDALIVAQELAALERVRDRAPVCPDCGVAAIATERGYEHGCAPVAELEPATVTITAFVADRDASECRACVNGQQREEDDAGSYPVACEDCDGHGRFDQCSCCNDLATMRARAEVDGLRFDELACGAFECIGTAVLTCQKRAADQLARKAKRDAQVAADVARESCAKCESPIVCCECSKAAA